MNNEKEKRLALLNGERDTLYKQNIIRKTRSKYSSVDDEIAILRKTIAELIDKLSAIGIETEEFKEYNFYVEDCKIKVKKEIDS